jgi:hypothetical protein
MIDIAPTSRDRDTARITFGVAGLLCLLTSIGIFEWQMTVMFYDKSIDVRTSASDHRPLIADVTVP